MPASCIFGPLIPKVVGSGLKACNKYRLCCGGEVEEQLHLVMGLPMWSVKKCMIWLKLLRALGWGKTTDMGVSDM